MVPSAGSAYTYAYATMGELFAWIIGWDLILEYAMSCAIVASGWSGHLDEFLQVAFGRGLPTAIASDPFSLPGAWLNLPAVLIMAVISLILVLGIRQSATTNAVLVLTKLAVVCFVIVAGWSYSNPANWTDIPVASRVPPEGQAQKWGILGLLGLHHWLLPLGDPIHSPFAPSGLSGMMLGASVVFFAYTGSYPAIGRSWTVFSLHAALASTHSA